MKKLIFLYLFLFLIIQSFGQTQGISYQAVIIDENPQEVPGVDIADNFLPNQEIMVRFSILDAAGTIEYQEEHLCSTDTYGMINLIIGWGVPTSTSTNIFQDIDWNGASKDLKVDISLSASDVFYTDFSFEQLTFVPYAYHKNITATGSMIIDGVSNLNSRLNVANGSPTFLSGNLTVDKQTSLQDELTVNAPSLLNDQVTISANVSGNKSSYSSYPLRVEGSNQGVAIKINGSRSTDNHFITFWDDEKIQGRIEGQTTSNLLGDPEYIFDNVLFANEILRSTVDVAKAIAGVASASSSSTACAGLGACVTAPIPSLIVGAIAEVVMETANLVLCIAEPVIYNISKHTNIGITYQSGAGDYAEWLPRLNPDEKFNPGDIVGVKAGHITKSTENADNLMVISHVPIVLGNMPDSGKEAYYEKVAFMGQVPVKVFGKVKPGDYILPSGNNNGTGIAVSPDDMQPNQYQKIVGIAWSESETEQYNFITLAVGINSNDIASLSLKQEQKIKDQESEINSLKEQLIQMNTALSQLVPGYNSLIQNDQQITSSSQDFIQIQDEYEEERTIVYFKITREQILEGINLAEKTLKEKGVDISENQFFTKIKSQPEFKESFIQELLGSVEKEVEKQSVNDIKSGAKVIKY
ncbi:MAG: hypothetical protein K8R31_06805 [Bacteroidales bacterium]|nr:hypothetical protein [Bacteroidales bacterium]